MNDLETLDLAKNLAIVGARMCNHARDIIVEIQTPEGAEAFAVQLEEFARQVRLRAPVEDGEVVATSNDASAGPDTDRAPSC